MALVPYRVSGRAVDQSASTRTFQIAQYCLTLRQEPQNSASLAPSCGGQVKEDSRAANASHVENLDNVGLVVWQSAFVLAEWLLRNPPFRQWDDVSVVELGCGTGVTGIALALAGAGVTMTDREHVLHLTRSNVEANCIGACFSRVQVAQYEWGEDVSSLGQPDVVVGADVVYQRESYAALAKTLAALCLPHTVAFIAFRSRGRDEEAFQRELSLHQMACIPVPHASLHEEYADGTYHILRICHLG